MNLFKVRGADYAFGRGYLLENVDYSDISRSFQT